MVSLYTSSLNEAISSHGFPQHYYSDDTRPHLSSLRHSCFCSDLSMSCRRLVIDGSSSAETKSQQDWAAVNPWMSTPHVKISRSSQENSPSPSVIAYIVGQLYFSPHIPNPDVVMQVVLGTDRHFYPQGQLRSLLRPWPFKDWPPATRSWKVFPCTPPVPCNWSRTKLCNVISTSSSPHHIIPLHWLPLSAQIRLKPWCLPTMLKTD